MAPDTRLLLSNSRRRSEKLESPSRKVALLWFYNIDDAEDNGEDDDE